MTTVNRDRKYKRKMRVSANIIGTAARPRVSVHRSNQYTYAQAVDDTAQKTIIGYSSLQLRNTAKTKAKKSEEAMAVGKQLAKLLLEKKVDTVVFDRSRFAYNGRVKALADGLRAGGITV